MLQVFKSITIQITGVSPEFAEQLLTLPEELTQPAIENAAQNALVASALADSYQQSRKALESVQQTASEL
ncbi:MAG: hypothetical protein FRX49_13009 [Trebouxia sp. A1-2]|nr:MAG: hypothetical protein FRX49_13009 [Trebouxia sp. A1-2]